MGHSRGKRKSAPGGIIAPVEKIVHGMREKGFYAQGACPVPGAPA